MIRIEYQTRNLLLGTLMACALTGSLFAAPLASPVGAADPGPLARLAGDDEQEELPDKREEVEQAIEQLADIVKDRGEQDREAIELIDQTLIPEFKKSGPKDRAAIVKALDKCIKEKRKPNDEGLPNNSLHLAAAEALGMMGPESVKPLIGWVGHKQHDEDLALQRKLILSLGKTKDEKAADTLLDLLDNHQPQIQAAGAEALINYDGAEEKLRKRIFEDLLKTLMRVRAVIDQDQNEIIEHERWDIISGPIVSTLKRLSGQDINDAHDWQHWWNKNKKADWDAEE